MFIQAVHNTQPHGGKSGFRCREGGQGQGKHTDSWSLVRTRFRFYDSDFTVFPRVSSPVPLRIFLSVSASESPYCNHKRFRNGRSISASRCQNSLAHRKCCLCSLLSEMVVWAREWAASAVFTPPRTNMCTSLNHSFTYGAISCSFSE